MAHVDIPTDTLDLPGGGKFPLVGFGTWQLRGEECYAATLAALEAGYRHVDTATMYRNEDQVGRALRDSGVPRDEVFVTTKYNPRSGRPELAVLAESLDAMGLSYVDLWLVHAPDDSRNEAIWKSFVSAQADGHARDIGVSNFSVRPDRPRRRVVRGHARGQPDRVAAVAVRRGAGRRACRQRGVVLEGYSALRGGSLNDPVVRRVADEVGRTPAQVLVRWHVQHGIVVIPRSSKPDRVRANADVGGFSLSEEQMAALDALGRG